MKKLRFVSVIIFLLLFCPFIKQCEGSLNEKYVDLESKNNNYFDNVSFQFFKYFNESSENVFELAYDNGKLIIDGVIVEKKSIINDKGFFTVFSFCLLSISLIISSFLTLIYSFLEKHDKMRIFAILNIVFIISIQITFCFSGMFERIGQIKFGFYLLLFSNFYMMYLLKQKQQQI